MESILEILCRRAVEVPDRTACTVLIDGEIRERSFTYAELHRRVRIAADVMADRGLRGRRVLIVAHDALEFLPMFLGALAAGAVAVPAKLPTKTEHLNSTIGVVRDCQAELIAASGAALGRLPRLWSEHDAAPPIDWFDAAAPSHEITAPDFVLPPLESLAYLQYTSGSTRAPRGVMVSHRNLVCNLARVQHGVPQTPDSCGVQWLPLYHDLGLISLLFALYGGFHNVVLSPPQFLQRPARWLEAISRYRATLSGGPNFAYQLCAERIREPDRGALDLSCWQAAYCSAEPVRESTYRQFLTAFGPCGFKADAFIPCYGLAEYVAGVAAPNHGDTPRFLTLDARSLRSGVVQLCATAAESSEFENGKERSKSDDPDGDRLSIADCGVAGPDDALRIVHAETGRECGDLELGEIWLTGASLPQGYWNRPEETKTRFQARLADGRGPFLRTGDLGFVYKGRLFVTGRIDDLIILRGVNYFPQDIEHTVECCDAAIRPAGAAAFTIEIGGEAGLAVVAELTDASVADECDRIFAAILTAVGERHEVVPAQIALLRPHSLPKTTSGKVQRKACREALLTNKLTTVAVWCAPRKASDAEPSPISADDRRPAEIEAWLLARFAQRLGLNLSDIARDTPLVRYGLDSAAAVQIAGELEQWLGRRLPPTLFYECRTVAEACEHLERDFAPTTVRAPPAAATEHEPIAIVGLSCRFAGAPDAEAFWRLLVEQRDGIVEVPARSWNVDDLHDPDGAAPGRIVSRYGGFLADIDLFDPEMFGISHREASRMDPQQRLLLETAWDALEDAGIAPQRLAGSRTGTFIGIGNNDYSQVVRQFPDYLELIDAHCGTGTALSIAANRLSYVFDLRGPSLAVDTACSSASVALHLAVRSLRARECDAALAGGVNAILSPDASVAFSRAQMLSPDGRCRSFDEAAAGYVRSEGVGVAVLKRLSDALAAGDPIAAVIRGTAINQDGRTSGITSPNPLAQQACIEAALADAQLTIDDLSYIEAHGTGTPLGDPLEIQALSATFARRDRRLPAVVVGSCKPNIGHPETASGIAGLIKVCLMLRHNQIPPQAYFRRLNPHIRLEEDGPVKIAVAVEAWPAAGNPRVAGISSFGFGGTNAHLVVQEWLQPVAAPSKPEPDEPQLLTLSARSESSLRTTAERYAEFLSRDDAPAWSDVVHSSHLVRNLQTRRLAVVASDSKSAAAKLRRFAAGAADPDVVAGDDGGRRAEKIAFLYTGQGSQYVGMGRRLYATEPVFRRSLEASQELLRAELPLPLLSVVFAEAGGDAAKLIDRTLYTQPALVALERALTELWQSWGVRPDVVLGHSVGEYSAAAAAGAVSWDDALRLVARRAALMDLLPAAGAMLVVLGREAEVRRWVEEAAGTVEIAAFNGSENVVLSGAIDDVADFQRRCESRGITVERLAVSRAFHSRLIEPMLDEWERFAAGFTYHSPTIPLISNLHGRPFGRDEKPDAEYWRNHTRRAVRFSDGIRQSASAGVDAFVEIGPTPNLLSMGRRCLGTSSAKMLPTLSPQRDDVQSMLRALAALFVHGATIDWLEFGRARAGRRVPLPKSVLERSHIWFESGLDRVRSVSAGVSWGRGAALHPLLGTRLPTPLASTLYGSSLGLFTAPYLKDHVIQGSPTVPAAAYLEMALAAAAGIFGPGAHAVERVQFRQAMFVAENEPNVVQSAFSPEVQGRSSFEIYRLSDVETTTWTPHVSGTLRHAGATDDEPPGVVDLTAVRGRCSVDASVDDFYRAFDEHGLEYGPRFRSVRELRRTTGEALGRLQLSEALRTGLEKYTIHPALLDGAFQVLGAALDASVDSTTTFRGAYVPVAVEKLVVYARPGAEAWAHAVRVEATQAETDELIGDVQLFDDEGRETVAVRGLKLKRIGRDPTTTAAERRSRRFYALQWPQVPLPVRAETSRGQSWWIISDAAELARATASQLQNDGHACRLFPLAVCRKDDQALARLLTSETPQTVVYIADVDAPLCEGDADGVHAAAALSLLHASAGCQTPPRFWFVTQQAQAVGGESDVNVSGAVLWGFVRVAANEHPEYSPMLVDLDPGDGVETAAQQLLVELLGDGAEPQVAWRLGQRRAARLMRLAITPSRPNEQDPGGGKLPIPAGPYRVEVAAAGSPNGLQARPVGRRAPSGHEVEIEVAAAGLNFSDVLKTMGLYPGLNGGPATLGIECSGVVRAVGSEVTGVQVDQEVVAVAPFCFGAYVTTSATGVAAKPASVSFVDGATIPIAFVTAHYALTRLAQVRPGERVLIHAAAGGVGLAAVQIVQDAGGIVFATAGSPEKRDYLQSLGVKYVFDSRDPKFDEAIREATHREGVDVVLNSLPGEAITKSLGLLRVFGRFLEIGKLDLYRDKQIGLYPFHNHLSYFAIDLDRLIKERPDEVGAMLAEVMEHFSSGRYRPLPATVFPMAELRPALRFMQQRKNTGKIVLAARNHSNEPNSRDEVGSGIRRDASYLITGGTGSLGLAVAERLAARGAQAIWLVARRRPVLDVESRIELLRKSGVDVRVLAADVSDAVQLAAALQTVAGGPPLRGVFHAAGVLDDGLIRSLDRCRLQAVAAAKLQGAWNLHRLTRETSLDHFVSFSSVAALVGSPGQANYAAANAGLDALMHHRSKQGLPGLSINWGPWSAGGMVSTESGRLAARGMNGLAPADALDCLEELFDAGLPQASVMEVDWPSLLGGLPNGAPPLLRGLAEEVPVTKTDDLRLRLLESEPERRNDLLTEILRERLARILETDVQRIDVAQPLNLMGLDSLMALELRNWVESSLAVKVPIVNFMQGLNVLGLAEFLVGRLRDETIASAPPAAASKESSSRLPRATNELIDARQAADLLERLDDLSDAEVDALLASMRTETGTA